MFNDEMSLGEARDLLRELVEDGYRCPCCTQFAKIYRRKIHATMARELIRCWRVARDDWFHLATVIGHNGGDVAKCAYWGLMEEETMLRREDGGRAGWWHVTPAGARFVAGYITVPKYARIYDGRCLGLIGDPVTIRDALGARFSYDELMAA